MPKGIYPRKPPSTKILLKRFWLKVDKTNGCWNWIGALYTGGYGYFWNGNKHVGAHRWSYEHFVGPIPLGLQIDHLCRNRLCVNSNHLEPVTQKENLMRGNTIPAIHAAKTHCIHGHKFTHENTYISKTKWGIGRGCKSCNKIRSMERNIKKKKKRYLYLK